MSPRDAVRSAVSSADRAAAALEVSVLVGEGRHRPTLMFAVDAAGRRLDVSPNDSGHAAFAAAVDLDALIARPEVQEAIGHARDGEMTPLTIRIGGASIEGAIDALTDASGRVAAIVAFGYETTDYQRAIEAVRDRENRLRTILDTILDAIIVIDERGLIESFNASAARIFGYSPGEVIGRNVSLLMPDPDQSRHEGYMARYLASGEAHIIGIGRKVTARRKDGGLFTLELSVAEMRSGARRRFIASARDLTERERWQEALRESEQRYAILAESANDGLWELSLADRKMHFSPRFLAILGREAERVAPDFAYWRDQVHPEDRDRFTTLFEMYLAGEGDRLEVEHRLAHADGGWRHVLARGLAVRDPQGRVSRVAGSLSDVTEAKLAERMVEHAALHDQLTGLPNRALLLDRIEHMLRARRAHPERAPFAVMMLNLDRFKVLNDSLGHSVGNQIISTVAQRVAQLVDEDDTLAHLGGDEFALVLNDAGRDQVDGFARSLLAAVHGPLDVGGRRVALKASLGARRQEPGDAAAADIVRDAGLAMFAAKGEGGARMAWFAPEMRQRSATLLGIETEIREALDEGRLRTYYQPIIDLRSGRVDGFEALARIITRRGQVLPPSEFIPVAEQAGLIVPVGLTVLETACADAASWRAVAPWLTIAVNLSALQFGQADLVERVASVLRRTQMVGAVKLEVTEGALIQDPDRAAETLTRLRSLGVRIALDDFGTGYSSLSYLDRFPIDILKIDRSFVTRMTQRRRHLDLVQGIIGLARTLDMEVVAEGVENEAQADALRAMGCEYGQGYAFGRPMPSEQVLLTVMR